MNTFKLVSYNIDTNLSRYEENAQLTGSMPNWRVSKRVPDILYYLEKSDAGIICLQELRNCVVDDNNRVDSVTPLVDGLKSLGYEVLISAYNPYRGDRSFKYLTAYKSDLFTFIDQKMIPFTKSGEFLTQDQRSEMADFQIKYHNFGPINERGAFAVSFKNVAGRIFQVINAHIDIPWGVRRESSRILGEYIAEVRKIMPVICVGDYNSFPDWNGTEQCDSIMELGGCKNALAHYNSSFIAFPYDWGKNDTRLKKLGLLDRLQEIKIEEEIVPAYLEVYEKECDAMGGRLDNVFHAGFINVSAEVKLTPVIHDDNVSFEESVIKTYVLERARVGMPAFASDHQLIDVIIEL